MILSFKKYFYVIFNEQTGLYYANKQWNHFLRLGSFIAAAR